VLWEQGVVSSNLTVPTSGLYYGVVLRVSTDSGREHR
jgi:hypothetical protein